MCKHENLAKIDKVWRCRDCGEIFTEPPKAGKVIVKEDEAPVAEPIKKSPVKRAAKKGAK
jgi:ribosomal protein L37AE/L43A